MDCLPVGPFEHLLGAGIPRLDPHKSRIHLCNLWLQWRRRLGHQNNSSTPSRQAGNELCEVSARQCVWDGGSSLILPYGLARRKVPASLPSRRRYSKTLSKTYICNLGKRWIVTGNKRAPSLDSGFLQPGCVRHVTFPSATFPTPCVVVVDNDDDRGIQAQHTEGTERARPAVRLAASHAHNIPPASMCGDYTAGGGGRRRF